MAECYSNKKIILSFSCIILVEFFPFWSFYLLLDATCFMLSYLHMSGDCIGCPLILHFNIRYTCPHTHLHKDTRMAPPLATQIWHQSSRDSAADIHYPSHHVPQSSLKDNRRVKCPCTNTKYCMGVCVCLIRVHYAGLQSQMQRPGCAKELILHSTTSSSLPRKHSQDHSAHAHSRKSLSLTHIHRDHHIHTLT